MLPRRMTRYILAEFFKVFLMTSAALTVVMVVAVVAQEAVRQSLGPQAALKLLPYSLPVALLYAIPGTTLFAACSIYGRISAANEMVAVSSLGISPLALLRPALLFSFLTSLLVVWLNDYPAAWGRQGIKRVVLESVEQIAYGMLRANRSYSTERLSINVAGVDGHKLLRPTLRLYTDADEPPLEIRARVAEITTDVKREALVISFTDGEIEKGNRVRGVFHGRTERFEVSLSDAAAKAGTAGRPVDTPLSQMAAAISSQRQEILQQEQKLAAEAALQLMSGEFTDLTTVDWQDEEKKLVTSKTRLSRLHTEPWRRWANGFSCLAFVMVGAPLAVRIRSADVWTSFLCCFAPILVGYYPLLAYGVDLAKSGELPPCCVWLGNLVLFAVGYWMLQRVQRY